MALLIAPPSAASTAPTTSVVVPANGATVSATTTLDAIATNATSVAFYLFGGSYYGLLVGSATPTEYGWIYEWNTTTVPNGSYELFSKATGPGGSTVSSGIDLTVASTSAWASLWETQPAELTSLTTQTSNVEQGALPIANSVATEGTVSSQELTSLL